MSRAPSHIDNMSAPLPDLFGTVLNGFDHVEALISREEESELIARIDSSGLAPFRFQGWLGNPATLRLRRRRREGGFDRFAAPLEPRSACHLSGEARHAWEHSIAPMDVPRRSVTFRSLSEKGRRASA